MMKNPLSPVKIIIGLLSLPFLLGHKKVHTKPRTTDTTYPKDGGERDEPPPPQIELIRPNTKRLEAERREDYTQSKGRPPKKSRWTYKRMQLLLTFLVIAATVINAIGFVYSLREMRISRELENRAWMTAKVAQMVQFESGQIAVVRATVVNKGKTPAQRVIVGAEVVVSDKPPSLENVVKFGEIKRGVGWTLPSDTLPPATVGVDMESTVEFQSSPINEQFNILDKKRSIVS